MIFSRRALRSLPMMIAVLLSACGGGETTPLDTTTFVANARRQDCSGIRNKLYVIDNRTVLSERIGNCPDNSYAQVLYGANVETVLCYAQQTIAGPVSSCKEPAYAALFDTMRKNLDRPDLGLGASHSVREVSFVSLDGTSPASDILFSNAFSGIATPTQVVVRDAGAFAALWKQHGANTSPAPAIPTVDFNTHMVIGLFAGTSQGCHDAVLQRLVFSGDVLFAQYMVRHIAQGAVCNAALTAPMQLTIVKRIDGEVVFMRNMPPQQ